MIESNQSRASVPRDAIPDEFEHALELVNVVPFWEFVVQPVNQASKWLGFGYGVGGLGIGLVAMGVFPEFAPFPVMVIVGAGSVGTCVGVLAGQGKIDDLVTDYLDNFQLYRRENDTHSYTKREAEITKRAWIPSADKKSWKPMNLTDSHIRRIKQMSDQGLLNYGMAFKRDKMFDFVDDYGEFKRQCARNLFIIDKGKAGGSITYRGEFFFSRIDSPTLRQDMKDYDNGSADDDPDDRPDGAGRG